MLKTLDYYEIPDPGERIPRLAGFWIRFAAFLIDLILRGLATGIILYVVDGITTDDNFRMSNFFALLQLLVFFLIGWVYSAFPESSSFQGTYGKIALGLKVTTLEGQRLTFGHASRRYLCKWLFSYAPIFTGFIWIVASDTKQAFHDVVAGTLVFR